MSGVTLRPRVRPAPRETFADPQDEADALVGAAVAAAIRPRALARALVKAAGNAVAALESEQAAADVTFLRWRKHTERIARAPRKSGSQR